MPIPLPSPAVGSDIGSLPGAPSPPTSAPNPLGGLGTSPPSPPSPPQPGSDPMIDQQKVSVLDQIRQVQTTVLALASAFPMASEAANQCINDLMQMQMMIVTSLGATSTQPAPSLMGL